MQPWDVGCVGEQSVTAPDHDGIWCQISPRSLDEVAGWIEEHRILWERVLDRFDQHIERAKAFER